jgi:SAM-dependent methyltransferase
VVSDLPHVVNGATAIFEQEGLSDRAKAECGDFFQSVPADADGYIMSHIIHDWSDSKSLEILKNIRKVIRPNGKLLLAETVILPGPNAINSTLMDLNMLVMTPGGRERTQSEYETLLAQAGFTLVNVITVSPMASIIEAAPTAH